ncbi:unnamed protein product [Caenorhabditis auriculariae]|uniref:Uncharacterized protein n=1 Tax=Caenorhabditis auriculariae TaxID=2777116 RepID=A0A8S1H8B8_9PELO|nr:unnamed protein product [Caenorhabditis auriculariae]
MGTTPSYYAHSYPSATMIVHHQPPISHHVSEPQFRRASASHFTCHSATGMTSGTNSSPIHSSTSACGFGGGSGFSSQFAMPVQYYPNNVYGNGVTRSFYAPATTVSTMRNGSFSRSPTVVTVSHYSNIPSTVPSPPARQMTSPSAPEDHPPSYEAATKQIYPKFDASDRRLIDSNTM